MKTFLAILLLLALGAGLGFGMAYWRFYESPWISDFDAGREAPPAETRQGPRPKAVIRETTFEFGTLDMTGSGNHEFVVSNAGDAPLELTSGPTSCRCTMTKMEQERVPPGGSAKIPVSWKPTELPGPYTQTATILTNDPERPRIVLTISGRITVAAQLFPSELVFSRLAINETAAAESRLLGFLDAPVEVLGHEWSEPATARFFEAVFKPLSLEEAQQEQPTARSGQRILVRVKPGLPQGPLHQQLILRTNVPSAPRLTLTIRGAIGSEVSIAGPGWNADTGVLTLGEIAGDAGAQRQLLLVVRGPARRDTSFSIGEVEPNVLRASLGRPTDINQGAVVQTPLTISIPPGSPTVNRMGLESSRQGRIVLKTTHPQVPEIQIHVRFAVVEEH